MPVPDHRARRNVWVALALWATLFAWCPTRAQAQSLAALVTDAKGKVEIQRSGQAWSAASVMTQVPAGSLVRVAAGGSAHLSFVQGGLKVSLSGPVTVRAEAAGVQVVQGAASSVQSSRPSGRVAMAVSGNVNVDRMGGTLVRNVGADIVLLSGPTVLSPQMTLQWRTGQEDDKTPSKTFSQYEVRILNPQKAVAFEGKVDGNVRTLAIPPGMLVAGNIYKVSVTGSPPIGIDPSTATRTITILDEQSATPIEEARREAETTYKSHPADVSPLVLLTWMYIDKKMYGDALPLAERIVAARPDSLDACVVLYRLYSELGLTDKATDLRQRAGIKDEE